MKRNKIKWNTQRNSKRNVKLKKPNKLKSLVKLLKRREKLNKRLKRNKSKFQNQGQRNQRKGTNMLMTINLMAISKKCQLVSRRKMIISPHQCKIDLINSVPSSAGCSGSLSLLSSNTLWFTRSSCATIT